MAAFIQKLFKQAGLIPIFLSTQLATKNCIPKFKSEIEPQKANQDEGLDQAAYQVQIQPLFS
jgi:hypothetical protein